MTGSDVGAAHFPRPRRQSGEGDGRRARLVTAARRLRPALLPIYGWFIGYDLLFAAYVLCVGSVFFGNSGKAPHALLWTCLVLAVAPSLWRQVYPLIRCRHLIAPRGFSEIFAVRRSVVFGGAVLYLLALSFSSAVNARAETDLAEDLFLPAVEITLFLVTTALLTVHYKAFLSRVFAITGCLVAVSAAVNMTWFALTDGLVAAHLVPTRLTPILGTPGNQVATTAGLTCAVFLVGIITAAGAARFAGLPRAAVWTSGLFLLLALLWTQTRGAMLAAAVAIAVFAGLTLRRSARIAAAVGFAMVLLAAFAAPSLRQAILSRGSSLRLEIWEGYLSLAADLGLSGYGQFAETRLSLASGFTADHPHNLILSSYILGGPLAAAAMLTVFLAGAYSSWLAFRELRIFAPLCLVITLAVAGMVDYALVISYPNWYWAIFWMPIGILIGTEISVRNRLAAGRGLSVDSREHLAGAPS